MARIRRHLAEVRRQSRAARRDYWLRCIGYVTRPVVYLGPIVLAAWWVWPYASGLGRFLDSLTAIDVLLFAGCLVGLIGVAVPLALMVFNVGGAGLDWEQWGRFGLGFAVVGASTTLWLA